MIHVRVRGEVKFIGWDGGWYVVSQKTHFTKTHADGTKKRIPFLVTCPPDFTAPGHTRLNLTAVIANRRLVVAVGEYSLADLNMINSLNPAKQSINVFADFGGPAYTLALPQHRRKSYINLYHLAVAPDELTVAVAWDNNFVVFDLDA